MDKKNQDKQISLLKRFRIDAHLTEYYFTGETCSVYATIENLMRYNKELLKWYQRMKPEKCIMIPKKIFGPAVYAHGDIKTQNGNFLLGVYEYRPDIAQREQRREQTQGQTDASDVYKNQEEPKEPTNFFQGILLLEEGLEKKILNVRTDRRNERRITPDRRMVNRRQTKKQERQEPRQEPSRKTIYMPKDETSPAINLRYDPTQDQAV